jgi:multiple sugar transport system permease protein
MSRGMARIRHSHLTYLLPAVIVLLVVTIYPTIRGVWLSFHEMPVGGGGELEWVGFKNYSILFRQAEVRNSFVTTLLFVGGTVTLSFIVGFLLAILARRQFQGKTIYMGLFILPVVATPVVSGMMWKLMLSTEFGIINWAIGLFGMGLSPGLPAGQRHCYR